MRRLSAVLIAAVSVVAFTQIASAADLPRKAPVYAPPPAPVFSWTGFYVGGTVGGGWARQGVDVIPCDTCGTIAQSGRLKGSSILGGVYAGYNYMFTPQFLAGVEGDFVWTHLNESQSIGSILTNGAPDFPGSGISFSHDIKWLASLRGRLGWAFMPNALLYATGGIAWAHIDYSAIYSYSGGCAINNCGVVPSFNKTQDGFVVGGGVEWAPWNNNWLVRAEYLYYQFNGTTVSADFPPACGGCGLAATFKWGDLSINTVRGGIAYKF